MSLYDFSNLSEEKLYEKYNELMTKLSDAYERGSHQSMSALQTVRTALEMEIQLRQEARMAKEIKSGVIMTTGKQKPKEDKKEPSKRPVGINKIGAMSRRSTPKGEE